MTVWVVLINHKYGTDVDVFKTEDEALAGLDAYVQQEWTDYCKDVAKPAEASERIELYFHRAGEQSVPEYYELSEKEVRGSAE